MATCAALPLGLACKVGPDYAPPESPIPPSWSATELTEAGASTSQPAEQGAADLHRWWQHLGDPALTALVEQAAQANLEIRLADARLREAIALRKGDYAELFPAFALDSSYVHERAARNRSIDEGGGDFSASLSRSVSNVDGIGPPTAQIRFRDSTVTIRPPEPGSGRTFPEVSASRSRTWGGPDDGFQRDRNGYQTLLGATWELDVWGGIRRAVEAADAEVLASLEDRHAIIVAITAEVARNYVVLRGLQRLIEVTHNNIAIQRETLESIQSRFAASLATGTDVLQAETQLQRTEAELPPLRAGVRQTIHRLGVLLGQPPAYLLDELEAPQPLPELPDALQVGLPSELLRRRPDIRAAERRVAAETALIGVEVAELYPRFSLTGSFGLQAASFSRYVEADSLTWAFGPGVRWRLMEFGRVLSAIEAQEERQEQALLLYQRTVLEALEQVESSLANYAAQKHRAAALETVNAVNTRAFELAKGEYAVGMISFLSVLDTQRSLFSTQTELIQSQQQTLIELINLYEALGGGWPDFPENETE
jgi:NodT family efflux transporter outer membrane factor (OMF) lipoprotein